MHACIYFAWALVRDDSKYLPAVFWRGAERLYSVPAVEETRMEQSQVESNMGVHRGSSGG